MAWRSDACCLMLSIDKAATSTIVLRTRIDRHVDESGRCNASSPPTRRRISYPLTHSSMVTSIHADTSWQPQPTVPMMAKSHSFAVTGPASGDPAIPGA
jgi:hypothetical protein